MQNELVVLYGKCVDHWIIINKFYTKITALADELIELKSTTNPTNNMFVESHSAGSSSTAMSDRSGTFMTKNRPKLPPVAKPRQRTLPLDITSDDISDITNTDYHENTSKSDMRSYRDKLRDRFMNVKQQSEKTMKSAKSKSFKHHAGNVGSLNRCVELIKRENEEIDSQLREYKGIEIRESTISKTEKYQFFCESLPENFGEDGEMVAHEENENLEEERGSLCWNVKAECRIDEIVGNEAQIFLKSTSQNNLKEEIKDQRKLLEEGLYTPKLPRLPSKQLSLLEARLYAMDDKKWFNCNGDLNFVENPYSKTSFRPEGFSTPTTVETEFHKATTYYDNFLESVKISQSYTLDIGIYNIKFKHHPLFSIEHVLQEKLVDLYDLHREYVVSNKLERMHKKLESLRKAKVNAQQNINAAGDVITDFRAFSRQIKSIREEYFNESKIYRDNIKLILNTWKGIKAVREQNKFSNTTIKLEIRTETCEDNKDDYKYAFQQTYNELLTELENDFEISMMDYKRQLSDWKQRSENEALHKPKKPIKQFDSDEIKSDLKQVFKETFRTPGEPILHFRINYDNEMTKNLDGPKEVQRRNDVALRKIHLRFMCNGLEVCKSKPKPLSELFVCHFDDSVRLKLAMIPEYIMVEIYEQTGKFAKHKLGELKLLIPPTNIITGHVKMNEEYFVSSEEVYFKHAGIGSGVNMQEITKSYDFDNIGGDLLQTNGFLNCSVAWNMSKPNEFTGGAGIRANSDILGMDGSIDVEKLQSWIESTQPDPQDPKNAVIFDYLKSCESKLEHNYGRKQYFRCDPYLYPLEICSRADLESNVRFQLLGLRDKNEPEFMGMVVPNRLKEIPTNIFSTYNRRLAEENIEDHLQEDDYDDEINSRRSYGRKYLRQIHTNIFVMCRNAENILCYEDVVNEKSISLIQDFFTRIVSNIIRIFRIDPNSSKPLPMQRLFQTETDNLIANASPPKIVIRIIKGLNLPTRKKVSRRKSANEQECKTAAFIEVVYQQMKEVTGIASGKNPLWNEELKFPLESASTDYLSPNALSGSILLNIFDKLADAKIDDVENINWLGSIEIPIAAICQTSKLEGLFLVKTASTILGYAQEQELQQGATKKLNIPTNIYANYTYLNLKISVEPNIPKLTPDMESLPSAEPPYLKGHILTWSTKYNIEHPKRKFSPFAIDCNGKTVCVTRYIKKLELPQMNQDGFDVTADQCARYVSMIPFTDCNKFYQNMWLTTEQLLRLGVGSLVDHAVALTCYLVTLNLEVWLVLGQGIPHGITAYVLMREYISETLMPIHYIYDVFNGNKYNVIDPFSPLQRVFCVINEHNVWANIQRTDTVATTRFEFTRRFDWLPLFNNQITAPTSSVQQKLLYLSEYDTQSIQMHIEKKLRKKLAKLRTHDCTIWNHHISNLFKQGMNRLETNIMHGKLHGSFTQEIEELFKTYKITGIIINLPFSSVNAVVDKILSAKIHLTHGRHLEFASAIHVHPYPNKVLVVWIALLSVKKKQ